MQDENHNHGTRYGMGVIERAGKERERRSSNRRNIALLARAAAHAPPLPAAQHASILPVPRPLSEVHCRAQCCAREGVAGISGRVEIRHLGPSAAPLQRIVGVSAPRDRRRREAQGRTQEGAPVLIRGLLRNASAKKNGAHTGAFQASARLPRSAL